MAKTNTPPPKIHHYGRTMLAALLGFIALVMVSASIMVVWANRTLTDTSTYVATIGPVIEKPELQELVANKLTNDITNSSPVDDIASKLLTPEQTAGKTPEQVQTMVEAVIHDSVIQTLQSKPVEEAWRRTNQSQHAELVRQLDANAAVITLDLGPLVDTVVLELKQTKFAPVADKLDVKPGATKVELKGAPLERVHNAYTGLKTAPLVVVLLALMFGALSVWASVHHLKTLRRMLVSTGVSALLVAGVIGLPGFVRLPASDPNAGKLGAALIGTLLHGLQTGCLVLGVVCLAAAAGTKAYEHWHK